MLFIRLTTTPSLLQMDAVPSADVPMAILRHRLVDTDDLDEKMAIVDEMKLLLRVTSILQLHKQMSKRTLYSGRLRNLTLP